MDQKVLRSLSLVGQAPGEQGLESTVFPNPFIQDGVSATLEMTQTETSAQRRAGPRQLVGLMRPCLSWSCTVTSPGLVSGPSKVPVPPPEAHLGLTHPCPTLPNTGTCGLSSQEPSNSPASGRVSSPAAPQPSVRWMKIT